MSIDSGFNSNGFVDDREEQERWGLIDKKLSQDSTPTKKEETDVVDGRMEVSEDGKSDWAEDIQKSSIKEYKRKKVSKNQGFFKRNKREIFDALVILGIVYVGYKLFFEKEEGGDFDNGGEVDYTPTPQEITSPAPAPVNLAPPKPELPEATFNPEA
jgi:hypothetical protein